MLFVAWELLVQAGAVNRLLLPAPTDVAPSLWEDRAILGPDLAVTTWEVVLGLTAALVFGAGLAVAMHLVPAVERALRPLVVGSQAVPIPVLAPLVVFVLGFGLAPKILIVALICFFPVVVNVADGLRDSDPDSRRVLRSLHATRWQRLRFLDAPSALPAGLHGHEDRGGGRGDRRGAGGVGGLDVRARPSRGHRQRSARERAGVRGDGAADRRGGRALRPVRGARTARRRLGAEGGGMRRLIALAALLLLAGCGEKAEPTGEGPARQEPFTVMLDYFPNADHAGIYAAQAAGLYEQAGLDVKLQPPPDPSAPLRLLAAGRADVAISYEPELLLARDQGEDSSSPSARSSRSR